MVSDASGRRFTETALRIHAMPFFAILPPQLRIFAFVPAASASLMLPARL